MSRFLTRRCAVSALLIHFVACQFAGPVARAQPAPGGSGDNGLSLADYMQRVVANNETVQARLLAFQATRSQRLAENGAFEPALVASGTHVDRDRPNTIEVERSLRSGGVFKERNENYGTALEMQTPLGTRLRVGATAGELRNNVQRTVIIDLDAEYEAQVGVSIEQPLLRNGGRAAALAALRVAARSSEIAFQEYRRHLMSVVAEAELAYWQLYYAQQEEKLAGESVALSQTLVQDTRAALEAGRGSRLEVLESEAGSALRRSRQGMAQQRRIEAANRLAMFLGSRGGAAGVAFRAIEAPPLRSVEVVRQEGEQVAFAMNPEYLRAQSQIAQEMVRAGYSKNQRLPQLDLKSSFGANGLGFDWSSAWRDVEKQEFRTWTVGLELRIPILGNIRGRNEYRAAMLRVRQAERMAAEVGGQLRAGMDSVSKRVDAAYTAAQNYTAIVEFRGNLLETRMQSRDVGRLDSRNVLEAEQDLFAARLERLQSMIEYERALLDLQVLSGSLLQNRGLELGFTELEARTNEWLKAPAAAVSSLRYQPAVFIRWPAAPAVPFVGEPDPSYPWRLQLTRPLPWKRN